MGSSASTERPVIVSGWLPSMSIGDVVMDHPEVFNPDARVLISSIDSNLNVGELPFARDLSTGESRSSSRSLKPFVINGEVLQDLVSRNDLFTGFDEIWLLSDEVSAGPPPEVSLVAPMRLANSPSPEIQNWMMTSGSKLGLGDGDGLNFVGELPLVSLLGLSVSH